MTTTRPSSTARAPGTFTDWDALPASDLLFYEGLHGCVVTERSICRAMPI